MTSSNLLFILCQANNQCNPLLLLIGCSCLICDVILVLETFTGLEQKNGAGSKACIPRVVSKPDSDHGTATTAHRTLGLTPAGTICRRNLSLSHYPIHRPCNDTYTRPIVKTLPPIL